MAEEDEIKILQAEVQKLAEELQTTKTKLQFVYNRLLQLQNKGAAAIPAKFKKQRPVHQPFTIENFIGLRLIHVVGIVVLVIGLSIGVKYAIDRELISENARLGLAYAAGAVLYFLSLRLKQKYISFSAILFSGGMASLYFTTYAAFVYYGLFPFIVAFLLMIGLTLFTTFTALQYNRQEIAVLGLVGAYAIPFLISQNADRADLFFLYIFIINCAVIFLSYKKDWKEVSYLAQIITWFLFIAWATMRYQTKQQWIGLLFGILFFALFLFASLATNLLQKQSLKFREMQLLVLNNLAAYIAALFLFAPAFAAKEIGEVSIFFSVLVGVQAVLFHFFFSKELYSKKVLALLSLTLFLIFIANKWDGLTVTLLWLLTAVLLFVWGFWARVVWLRMASIILMGFTLLKLVTIDSMRFTTIQKIISYITLGILLLIVSFFYQKFKQKLFEESKE